MRVVPPRAVFPPFTSIQLRKTLGWNVLPPQDPLEEERR